MTQGSSTPAVVTIGNFDGVHRGHQFMLRQVADRAKSLGLKSYAITFFPDPQAVLRPEQPVRYLTKLDDRVRLIREAGIDDVWVCEFTRELSLLSPEEFMRLVAERQPIAELWIGYDFALGRGRTGTFSVLAEIGCREGWGLHMVPPYRHGDRVVSATTIRQLLDAGDRAGAEELLGHPLGAAQP